MVRHTDAQMQTRIRPRLGRNIIFGSVIDEEMQGALKITVIATGFSGAVVKGTSNARSQQKKERVKGSGSRQSVINPADSLPKPHQAQKPEAAQQSEPARGVAQPAAIPVSQPQTFVSSPSPTVAPQTGQIPAANGLDIPEFLQRRRFPRR